MEMKSMAVCDLRADQNSWGGKSYCLIESVALLILPKDADPELKTAILSIPKKSIATTMWLNEDDRIEAQNGVSHISEGSLSREHTTVCVINGVAVADAIPPETKVELIINGVVFCTKPTERKAD